MMGNLRWITVLTVLLFVLAACGGDDNGGDDANPNNDDTVTEEPTPTNAPEATATEEPQPAETQDPDALAQTDNQVIVVDQPAPGPTCAIVPEEGVVLDLLADADTDSTVLGQLEVGHYVLAGAQISPNWYQVSYPANPLDETYIFNDGVFLVGDCTCGRACLAFEIPADAAQITDCNLSYAADVQVISYMLPSENASIFSFSTAGDDAAGVAVARTADGWIGFDPGTPGTDASDGVSRLVWIQDGDPVTLDGAQCDSLPTYTYTPVLNP